MRDWSRDNEDILARLWLGHTPHNDNEILDWGTPELNFRDVYLWENMGESGWEKPQLPWAIKSRTQR